MTGFQLNMINKGVNVMHSAVCIPIDVGYLNLVNTFKWRIHFKR